MSTSIFLSHISKIVPTINFDQDVKNLITKANDLFRVQGFYLETKNWGTSIFNDIKSKATTLHTSIVFIIP